MKSKLGDSHIKSYLCSTSVAFNSTLAGHYIQGEGLDINQMGLEITNTLAKFKNYDVVNNSRGATNNFQINVIPTGTLEAGIKAAVEQGRTKPATTKCIALCAHSMPANNRIGLKKTSRWIRRSCVAEMPMLTPLNAQCTGQYANSETNVLTAKE